MQRNRVYTVTTLAKVAQEWEESEDLLDEITEQMDTEDGAIWVYGAEEHAVLAPSEDGIECLRDLLGEHRRDHQYFAVSTGCLLFERARVGKGDGRIAQHFSLIRAARARAACARAEAWVSRQAATR